MSTLKPHLNFIVLCKNLSHGNGTPTDLIGVFNRMALKNSGGTGALVEFAIAVSLRIEDFSRSYKLIIRIKNPDGSEMESGSDWVGGHNGQKITWATYPVTWKVSRVGTYWFKVYLDDELLGQAPMDVVVASSRNIDDDTQWPLFV
ncbi:MAG: hypothetical protein M3X11_22655 [Acidobacteriota bacterium]|nr:hypothetical protein [Acidobacteriota bacterium]